MKNKLKRVVLSTILCTAIGNTTVFSMEDKNSITYDKLAAGSCPNATDTKTISDATLAIYFSEMGMKLNNCTKQFEFGKNNRDRVSIIPSETNEPLKLVFVYMGKPTDSIFEFSTRPLTEEENFSSDGVSKPHVSKSINPAISRALYYDLIANSTLAKNLKEDNVEAYHYGYGVEGSARAILSMMFSKEYFSDRNHVVTFGSAQSFNSSAITQIKAAGAQIIHIYNENDPAFRSHFSKFTIDMKSSRLPGSIYLFKNGLMGELARAWGNNYEDLSEGDLRNINFRFTNNKQPFEFFTRVDSNQNNTNVQQTQSNVGANANLRHSQRNGNSRSAFRPTRPTRGFNFRPGTPQGNGGRNPRDIPSSFQRECNEDAGFNAAANVIGAIANQILSSENSNENPYFSDEKDLEFTSSDEGDNHNEFHKRTAAQEAMGDVFINGFQAIAGELFGNETGANAGDILRNFVPNSSQNNRN